MYLPIKLCVSCSNVKDVDKETFSIPVNNKILVFWVVFGFLSFLLLFLFLFVFVFVCLFVWFFFLIVIFLCNCFPLSVTTSNDISYAAMSGNHSFIFDRLII
jgi:hypothetical protein